MACGAVAGRAAVRACCRPIADALRLSLLLRAEQQDARDYVHEDERAYAQGHGVGLRAFVDAPGAHCHGYHPGQRDDEPAASGDGDEVQDEGDEPQRAVGVGHGVDDRNRGAGGCGLLDVDGHRGLGRLGGCGGRGGLGGVSGGLRSGCGGLGVSGCGMMVAGWLGVGSRGGLRGGCGGRGGRLPLGGRVVVGPCGAVPVAQLRRVAHRVRIPTCFCRHEPLLKSQLLSRNQYRASPVGGSVLSAIHTQRVIPREPLVGNMVNMYRLICLFLE